MSYKPSYVWPNPAFPFRVYYSDSKLRIFIIENIQHNWEWLSVYHKYFRESDIFFVYCGWYHSPWFAKEAERIFEELSLKKNKFFFLFNSLAEMNNFEEYGFVGDVINQNAWIDENLVMRHIPVEKKYSAIYVARLSGFKRHWLAGDVEKLALVAGNNHGNLEVGDIPDYVYKNDEPLQPDDVCQKINESECGLILSEEEGACFASSEYLLCGVPVVSTQSRGGRDAWYNEYNSIICEPSKKSIKEAVEFFCSHKKNPHKIRNDHIALAEVYRNKFIDVLGGFFEQFGVDLDPRDYFYQNFIHKLRKSYKPDFEAIFVIRS